MNAPHSVRRWPLALIALPAAVAVWSGWVGLGGMCGFGLVQPFPGIVSWHLDTSITLPIGVEAYGAYALGAWLTPGTPEQARTFARRSAIGALALGMLGQVVYHLLAAAHRTRAPWPVVVLVACLPVVTLGFGAALTHLLRVPAETGAARQDHDETAPPRAPENVSAAQLAELTDAVRSLGDMVSSTTQDNDETAPLADLADAVKALGAQVGDMISSTIPVGAEHAALIAYRASLAAGNPYSMNSLQARFGLTRAQVTRIRTGISDANGNQAPDALNGHQFAAVGGIEASNS